MTLLLVSMRSFRLALSLFRQLVREAAVIDRCLHLLNIDPVDIYPFSAYGVQEPGHPIFLLDHLQNTAVLLL